MAINIQNLIDVVNAKLAAADSAMSIEELIKLNTLKAEIEAPTNVLSYNSLNALPSSGSNNTGEIVYVKDDKYDKYGTFYFSNGLEWTRLNLTNDSDEDQIDRFNIYGPGYPGNQYGYATGGVSPSLTPPLVVEYGGIQRFSFASDGNASSVGSLNLARYGHSAQMNKTYGYSSDGSSPSQPVIRQGNIEKFQFFNETSITNVGSMATVHQDGSSQSSATDGYSTGGTPSPQDVIQKFPFATDTNAYEVANLSTAPPSVVHNDGTGCSAHAWGNGYALGSSPAYPAYNWKFPFANETANTIFGALNANTGNSITGISGWVNGYVAGGSTGTTTLIQKFPFAADTNASDVANLSINEYDGAGHSSTTYAYVSGGNPVRNQIQKWPFVSDVNATDVGDLLGNTANHGGLHV